MTFDDQLVHIIRALECLCTRYECTTEDLTAGLDPTLKNAIDAVLQRAANEVRTLARTAKKQDAVRMKCVADRLQSAAQADQKFGIAIKQLAARFGLRDAEAIDTHYAARPRPDFAYGLPCSPTIEKRSSTKDAWILKRPAFRSVMCSALSSTCTTSQYESSSNHRL